ncbi:MAG TPA: hypothetical protein VEH83_04610 [Gemmatimonadales bacterium]|nr:hypothetical protein [Gemmatimonadales bacterium]
MRRTPLGVLLCATVLLASCGEQATRSLAPSVPAAALPGARADAIATATCPTARSLAADVVALFATNDRVAAAASLSAAMVVVGTTPVLHSPVAQKFVLGFISFVLKKYWAGQLNGGFSSTTQQEVVNLVNGLLCWVGLPQNFTLASLSSDGTAAVLTPSTPDTTVVTGSKTAGLKVDSGSVTQPVLVTIQRLPDSPGPLLTQLDQYPIFYQFTVTPDTGSFTLPVTVGLCLANGVTPPDPTRLRVAHNVAPDTMGSIEILPLVPAPFVDCTNANLIGLRSSNPLANLAFGGLRAARSALAVLFSPERLMAATGGVGGTVKNFSPFGLVDTLVAMTPNSPTSQSGPIGTAVQAPSVRLTTPAGHHYSGIAVSFAVTAGGGSLTGGSATTDTTGVATAGSWALGTTPGANTATATATPPYSRSGILNNPTTFSATALGPTQLAFKVPPSNVVAGATMAPAVQVAVEDQNGDVITAASGTISLSLTGSPAGVTLTGGAAATITNGLATFSGLSVNKAGTYTLTPSTTVAGVTTLPASGSFTVSAGTPTQLVWTQSPSNVAAGSPVSPAVTVTVEDANNNVVTTASGTITLGLTGSPAGVTLTGGGAATITNGVATFAALSVNRVGTYTLTPSTSVSGVTTLPVSGSFMVSPGTPSQLQWTQQPSSITAGATMSPAVVLTVLDGQGNTVTSYTGAVSLAASQAGVSLGGTTGVNAAGGVATFSNLTVATAGTGYTLVATGASLTSAPSAPFNVTNGAAAAIAIAAGNNQTAPEGTAVAIPPSVRVTDAYGNPVPGVTVTFTPKTGCGSVTGGVQTTSATGTATVGSWKIAEGTNYLVATASASGVAGNPVTFVATGTEQHRSGH